MGVWIETTGAGPDLVLIHGVGTNHSIFSLAVPRLAEARRVSTLDLPGFGASDPPADGWTLAGVADTVAAALRARIDGPFDLLGSSLGGAVAITIALRHPGSVRRLILAAPAGFRPLLSPLPTIAAFASGPLMQLRRTAGLALADRGIARRVLLAGTVGDGAALDPDAARLLLRASEDSRSLGPALRAAASADLRERIAELEIPVGVIWGALDRVIAPVAVEQIVAALPETPVEVLPTAGHVPHLEQPRLFAAAVERLFSRLP